MRPDVNMTPDVIVDVACAHLKVPREHLSVRRPSRRTIYARSLITYLLRDLTPSTYPAIAEALGFAGDCRHLTPMLVQSAKRVSDGVYQAATDDLPMIREMLSAVSGRSVMLDLVATEARQRGRRA